MYTLDINKRIKKSIILYFFISIFLIVFDRIYAIFSHGVSSLSMNLMFLYPLIGGVGVYNVLKYLCKEKEIKFRITFNIYNTGIATLTIGSLLKGIMDIAGTSSQYIVCYRIIGVIFIIVSLLSFLREYTLYK